MSAWETSKSVTAINEFDALNKSEHMIIRIQIIFELAKQYQWLPNECSVIGFTGYFALDVMPGISFTMAFV